MSSSKKYLGHPDHITQHFPNSPSCDFEFTPDAKCLDFTLRDTSHHNTEDPSTHGFDSQSVITSSHRQQDPKSSRRDDTNSSRQDKTIKSKNNAMFLPYSASEKSSNDYNSVQNRKLNQSLEEKRDLKLQSSKKKMEVSSHKKVPSNSKVEKQNSYRTSKDLDSFEERLRCTSTNRTHKDTLSTMNNEIDGLRNKLKSKDREVTDNLRLIDNLQQTLNKGTQERFDMVIVQDLQVKNRRLEDENDELRETLRNEVLVSEKHRSQLEFAQNALEGKFDALGLRIPDPQCGKRGFDLLFEYQNLQLELHHKTEHIRQLLKDQNSLENKIEFLEGENHRLNRSLSDNRNEREKMQDDVENSLKALQSSRENQMRFEEERLQLIEYCNTQLATRDQLSQTVKDLESRLEDLQNESDKWKSDFENLQIENDTLKGEWDEKIELLAQLNVEKIELIEENQKVKEDAEISLKDLETMRHDKQKLETELSGLKQKIYQTEAEHQNFKDNQHKVINNFEKELERLNTEISESEAKRVQELQEKENLTKSTQEIRNSYNSKLQEYRRIYDDQAESERKLHEQTILELTETYERQIFEEKELHKTQLTIQEKEIEQRIQQEVSDYAWKVNDLLETKGKLEANTVGLESQVEALKKLSDGNAELKEQIQRLEKEKEGKLSELKNEYTNEVRRYESIIDLKNEEINTLSVTNLRLKTEVGELTESLGITTKNLEKTMRDFEVKNRELDNFKLLSENLEYEMTDIKVANGFLSRHYNKQGDEIDDYEEKMANTLTSLKFAEKTLYNLENDNAILKNENLELRRDLEELRQEYSRLQREFKEADEIRASNERKAEDLTEEIEQLRKDKDGLVNEKEIKDTEVTKLKDNEERVVVMTEELLDTLRMFVEGMNKNSATAKSFLANCTVELKEMLTSSYIKSNSGDQVSNLQQDCEYLQNWFVVLLREIEKDVLKILKLKEEVNQLKREITILAEKPNRNDQHNKFAADRAEDYRCQLNIIREEKKDLQERIFALQEREGLLEKESLRLKRENSELNLLINELKEANSQLRGSVDQISKDYYGSRSVLDNEASSVKVLKGHLENLFNEKKQLENLFHSIIKSIPGVEHARLAQSILEIQSEITKLEKENFTIESLLMEKESDLKICLKLGTKRSNEIIQQRREVENMRQELQDSNVQLDIQIKRRALLTDELSKFEKVEKRRFDHALDVERELLHTRDENKELRIKYEDLTVINSNLQSRLRELTESNAILQNSAISMKVSPVNPSLEDINPSMLKMGYMKSNERNLSRRLSIGHSEAASSVSGISTKHHRLVEPLQDRTSQEIQKQNYTDNSQSLIVQKNGSLKDKLSEAKHILRSMRSNKENL